VRVNLRFRSCSESGTDWFPEWVASTDWRHTVWVSVSGIDPHDRYPLVVIKLAFSSRTWNLHTFNFQYPLSGALWTFCSLKSRFRAVITASGRFRSSSAKSRSLTIASPVGYRWCVVWPYDESSLSQRPQFFPLFPLGSLGSHRVCFQRPKAYCRDPESRNDQ
jgi:hypothetical protein